MFVLVIRVLWIDLEIIGEYGDSSALLCYLNSKQLLDIKQKIKN
jgi:hypothetical protein